MKAGKWGVDQSICFVNRTFSSILGPVISLQDDSPINFSQPFSFSSYTMFNVAC